MKIDIPCPYDWRTSSPSGFHWVAHCELPTVLRYKPNRLTGGAQTRNETTRPVPARAGYRRESPPQLIDIGST